MHGFQPGPLRQAKVLRENKGLIRQDIPVSIIQKLLHLCRKIYMELSPPIFSAMDFMMGRIHLEPVFAK
jgi:hypothetical protein